jgi:hypothetical protein
MEADGVGEPFLYERAEVHGGLEARELASIGYLHRAWLDLLALAGVGERGDAIVA